MQYFVIASIFLGESLVVYAEVLGAKLHGMLGYSFQASILWSLIPGVLGTILLIVGYALGLKLFQNIWVVSALSVGTLLVIEPALNYFFVGQAPGLGSGIGFIFGVLGLLAVTFL
jgi:hypothetical protein